MNGTRVALPPHVREPFDVYVNGVPQEFGVDYELRDGALVFSRKLAKEGRVSAWRWLIGAFGVGTYRDNDTVDLRYESAGRPAIAHDLEF